MIVYTFDGSMDGLLTAVFDAYALHHQPADLMVAGGQLPLFCDEVHHVETDDEKAGRVWTGLEKRLSADAVRLITVSWLSELKELHSPLFHYIYKVFQQPVGARSIERNFADSDILEVTNIARRVMHEQLRMKQFIRFQKTKDGIYLGVVSPDHNVLPLVINHFRDRFGDQPWLIYDAKRRYGYYFDLKEVVRMTFQNEDELPFNLEDGKLDAEVLSNDDQLFQDLWRTYFKAICIRERMNPRNS